MTIPDPAAGRLAMRGVVPLFASPLTRMEIVGAEALNRQLLAEANALRAVSPGMNRSNWNGWHSDDDFFEREEPGFQLLKAHVLNALQVATQHAAPDFNFSRFGVEAEGWVNILGRGGLNTPHDHPGWTWSGCYYVAVPDLEDSADGSGAIEFFDVRTNARVLAVDGADCFASKYRVPPRAGQLLIFPSYLRHWVYPNPSEEERVSIAFNARFVTLDDPD
jgi:uncharacterized protein (TIGR02466 family)